MDDIAIFSNSLSDYKNILGIVLTKFRDVHPTVKVSKCKTGAIKDPYLGHWEGGGQVSPDPLKAESIVNWPIAKTKKQDQSFIGLANYYCWFENGFSDVSAYHRVVQKDKTQQSNIDGSLSERFQWGKENPVLTSPDFDRMFELSMHLFVYMYIWVLLSMIEG